MPHYFPVTVNAVNNPRNRLTGWSFRETLGVAGATINLRAGSVAGDIIETIVLDTGKATRHQYPRPINMANTQVYVEVLVGGGTVVGTLHGD